MTGESRSQWTHEIPTAKSFTWKNVKHFRERRISLTFRTVKNSKSNIQTKSKWWEQDLSNISFQISRNTKIYLLYRLGYFFIFEELVYPGSSVSSSLSSSVGFFARSSWPSFLSFFLSVIHCNANPIFTITNEAASIPIMTPTWRAIWPPLLPYNIKRDAFREW